MKKAPVIIGSSRNVITFHTLWCKHNTKVAHATATPFKKGDKFSSQVVNNVAEIVSVFKEAALDNDISAT